MPDLRKVEPTSTKKQTITNPTTTTTLTNMVPGEYSKPVNGDNGEVFVGDIMDNAPYNKTNQTTTTTSNTSYTGQVDANTLANYNKYNQDYVQSDSVTNAYNKLQQILNNKPGEFSSQYTEQLDNLYNQVINREAFSYDQNADVLYGLYKDQYNMAGNEAMKDTMGQMAAATGGFNSSAAQAAGYKAYANYMSELGSKALDLQSQAYNRYQDDTTMLTSKFNTTQDMYNKDYTKYRDTVADWQNDRGFYQDAYINERDFDYSMWNDNRAYWNSEYWNQRKSSTTTTSVTTTN